MWTLNQVGPLSGLSRARLVKDTDTRTDRRVVCLVSIISSAVEFYVTAVPIVSGVRGREQLVLKGHPDC